MNLAKVNDKNHSEKITDLINQRNHTHIDKGVRRFMYKYPLPVMTMALAIGYLGHWWLNKPASSHIQ